MSRACPFRVVVAADSAVEALPDISGGRRVDCLW